MEGLQAAFMEYLKALMDELFRTSEQIRNRGWVFHAPLRFAVTCQLTSSKSTITSGGACRGFHLQARQCEVLCDAVQQTENVTLTQWKSSQMEEARSQLEMWERGELLQMISSAMHSAKQKISRRSFLESTFAQKDAASWSLQVCSSVPAQALR